MSTTGSENRFDRFISYWKGHPVLSVCLIAGLAFISIAQLTDATEKLELFAKKIEISRAPNHDVSQPVKTDLDSLEIVSSAVVRSSDDRSKVTVRIELKNKSSDFQRYPSIDLQMRNKSGELIDRRIYNAEDYISAKPRMNGGVRPNMVTPFSIEAQDPAFESVHAYSIEMFYPSNQLPSR